MITIRQINKLKEGEWYVSYTAPHPCMCRDERFSITINQKSKPSEKKILDAINNQRKA